MYRHEKKNTDQTAYAKGDLGIVCTFREVHFPVTIIIVLAPKYRRKKPETDVYNDQKNLMESKENTVW